MRDKEILLLFKKNIEVYQILIIPLLNYNNMRSRRDKQEIPVVDIGKIIARI